MPKTSKTSAPKAPKTKAPARYNRMIPTGAEFGAYVLAIAGECQSGKIGTQLVFINHVWAEVARRHPKWAMCLEEFKIRLSDACKGGHIELMPGNIMEARLLADQRASKIAGSCHSLICLPR